MFFIGGAGGLLRFSNPRRKVEPEAHKDPCVLEACRFPWGRVLFVRRMLQALGFEGLGFRDEVSGTRTPLHQDGASAHILGIRHFGVMAKSRCDNPACCTAAKRLQNY